MFSLIIRKYFDKGNTKEVNYFSFCADVDRPEDMFPGYTPKREQVTYTAATIYGDEPPKATTTGKGFFAGSTKEINVLENRFMQ